MRDITCFRNRGVRTRVESLIKKVDVLDIDSTDYHNYTHAVAGILVRKHNMSDQIAVIQVGIDFLVLFDGDTCPDAMYEKFGTAIAGWFDDDNTYHEDYFLRKVAEELEEGKIIFIFMDFHNYIPFDEDEISVDNKYETHATALLLYPTRKGHYAAYHFNPHGQTGAYINAYTSCVSVRRRRVVPLKTGLDRHVIASLIDAQNRYLVVENATITKIRYNNSKHYNYVGPNLQAGDKYGVCYVFPTILLLEICKNYNNVYAIEYKEFDDRASALKTQTKTFITGKELIEQRKVMHLIWFAVAAYLPEAYKYIPPLEEIPGPISGDAGTTLSEMHHYNALEDIIEEKGSFFIKGVFGAVVLYLTQKPLRTEVGTRLPNCC